MSRHREARCDLLHTRSVNCITEKTDRMSYHRGGKHADSPSHTIGPGSGVSWGGDNMSSTPDVRLRSIDTATLTSLVRPALGSETIEVTDWDCEQVSGGMVSDVYRFSGDVGDKDRTIPWSLILKVVPPRPDAHDASGSYYWKREVLAYQSGFLDDLPGDLTAQRFLGIVEQPGGDSGSGWRRSGTRSGQCGLWSTTAWSPVTWPNSTAHTVWAGPCHPSPR